MRQVHIDKSQLKVGQVLIHSNIGLVRFTEECKMLEQMHGMPETLFVSDAGEIKEVTLALIDVKQ
jgi:hypothetical protein